MKNIKAEQKYIRMSPQKVRKVAELIKGLSPVQAVNELKFVNKRAAKPLRKTIKQAIANAQNNEKMDKENLEFKSIQIMPGATLKRWRAVARGRAHEILKRTSHIRVILKTKDE